MTSTINADKIMNGSGDQDSGLDLLVNDQVKIKTANTDRVTVTDATTTIANDLAAPTIKTATLKHTGGTTGLTIDSGGRTIINNTVRPRFQLGFSNDDFANVGTLGGSDYRITYTQLITNIGNCVADAGGGTYHTFTAPVDGLYCFYAAHYVNWTSNYFRAKATIYCNGSSSDNQTLMNWSAAHDTAQSTHINVPMYLTAGQTADSRLAGYDSNATSSTFQIYRNRQLSYFGGYLIG